jgi:RNA polymerase sigma factor (sigma-70 family)
MNNEEIFIKEAASGNEEAYAELINTYKSYVFAIILNFIKDYNEAENIAQEVFLQIYVSLNKFEYDNFKSWIGKIAANKSIDWLRKKKSKYKEELVDDEVLENSEANISNNPESLIVEKERRENLINMLNTLPDAYRDTLEKFYFQEKTYELIAEEDNVSVKTVASRLYRAKLLLKEKWRDENEAL